MDYNLLICASGKQWTAIDINSYGDCDRISFDGNETLLVESNEMLSNFCAQILNYYNINSYKDIELNIKIVMVSGYSSLIADLFSQMKDAKSINVIDAKSIIPIYVLKNCIVKPGSKMDVNCLEETFTLQVDDNLLVSFIDDKAGEEIVMEPESFSILFRFDCKNLISDEDELKAVEDKCKKEVEKKQKEIDKQKEKYSELKKEYDELEQYYIQLQNEVEESKTRFDDKRTILRFSIDVFKEGNSGSAYGGQFLSKIYTSMSPTSAFFGVNTIYSCKLLKSDGEVVKKGTELIEIIESIYRSNSEPIETGKKCIIKANEAGKIFYLVKNGDTIKDNEAVVLLSDSADKRSDIMKWYKDMK